MRITTKGRYALRAALALAKMGKNGEPVSIQNLAEEEKISSLFLEQIFFKLRKAGIVSSTRGSGGGFCFATDLDKLTVKQVLDAAGEELEITLCDKHKEECERMNECISHKILNEAHKIVNDYFSTVTLAAAFENHKDNGLVLQHEVV